MTEKLKRRVRIVQVLLGVAMFGAALTVLGWGFRHSDLRAVNVLLSIVNLALVSNVWINQRRMANRITTQLSEQANSAARLEALCEVLEADYLQRHGRALAPGDAKSTLVRILH